MAQRRTCPNCENRVEPPLGVPPIVIDCYFCGKRIAFDTARGWELVTHEQGEDADD